jgi:hypothetical protein
MTRYGHIPYSEALAMSRSEWLPYCEALARLLRAEAPKIVPGED